MPGVVLQIQGIACRPGKRKANRERMGPVGEKMVAAATPMSARSRLCSLSQPGGPHRSVRSELVRPAKDLLANLPEAPFRQGHEEAYHEDPSQETDRPARGELQHGGCRRARMVWGAGPPRVAPQRLWDVATAWLKAQTCRFRARCLSDRLMLAWERLDNIRFCSWQVDSIVGPHEKAGGSDPACLSSGAPESVGTRTGRGARSSEAGARQVRLGCQDHEWDPLATGSLPYRLPHQVESWPGTSLLSALLSRCSVEGQCRTSQCPRA